MSLPLPPLRLTGATILRDGALQRRSVSLAEGRITRGPLPEVDLSGYLILPGIVDLHGRAFERLTAPPLPLTAGLAATDRAAAAAGVTTACLAQGWSWQGGTSAPDHAERLMQALDACRPRLITDLRLHLRAEVHLVSDRDRLIGLVRRHGVGYVVFTDHLTEAREAQQTRPEAFRRRAALAGLGPEDLAAGLDRAAAAAAEVPRHLCDLAEAFDAMGVLYGSHGDPDAETRERHAMIGARVAEFPQTRRAAAAAKAIMSPVILGAPDVLGGPPPPGHAAALDLVAAGLCDALASGASYPALALAAWDLVDRGLVTLPRAWAMISTTPAAILGLADRGRLDPGLRADLVVMEAETRAVEAVITAGRLAFLAGEAGRRFLDQPQSLRMAAE